MGIEGQENAKYRLEIEPDLGESSYAWEPHVGYKGAVNRKKTESVRKEFVMKRR